MSGDAGRSASAPDTGEAREGATLVLGETSHDDACRRLANESANYAHRVRATTDAESGTCCASADDLYDTGVYEDLALAEAGIVVSDTIANLDGGVTEPNPLVVCVDGLPRPTDETGRQQLVQFLHAVTHRVGTANGRCHAHLAVDADDDLAEVVEPLFETVVDASP
ncbi:DUF7504 family protein [Halobacterium noricense]|uniref:DUF7504 family protein n=1 Tax=Halobacterium noricense TaxID=223182 RepID=UPI001E486BB5|nr:hypothetical protein [Halobacterium noricense]UHH26215.1 hypothetical protein LT974_04590 [Halobacterium noricense]